MQNTAQHNDSRPTRPRFGLPLIGIVGLALLAFPRVVLHDLDLIHEGTFVNALFVFVPLAVWIAVVLAKRVPNPFLTLLMVGVCYGVLLALGHQLLWNEVFGDDPPRLGGNLAGLDEGLQVVLMRSFATLSSLITGTITGAVCGIVAWLLAAAFRRGRTSPPVR